jgi:hypothetical protein
MSVVSTIGAGAESVRLTPVSEIEPIPQRQIIPTCEDADSQRPASPGQRGDQLPESGLVPPVGVGELAQLAPGSAGEPPTRQEPPQPPEGGSPRNLAYLQTNVDVR